MSTRTVDRKNFVAPLKQRRDFISEKIGFLSDLKASEPLRSAEIEAEQGKWADLFTAYNRRIKMLAQWGVRDFNEDSAALQEQRQPFVFRMEKYSTLVEFASDAKFSNQCGRHQQERHLHFQSAS